MRLIKAAASAFLLGWASLTPTMAQLQQCPTPKLAECQSAIENNIVGSCAAAYGTDLHRRSRAGSERQLLGRGLLKVISAFSPHKSVTERFMGNESQNITVNTFFEHGAMGGISYVLGFLTIIAFIGISIQACCWSCVGHPWVWKHPRSRQRTSKTTVISLFAILGFLYLLFFCGAVYYSSWTGPDIQSAGCTVNKVVDNGLFHETKTKKKGTFPGIITIRDQAHITSEALNNDFASSFIMPDHSVFIKRAVAAAFAPILFTDSVLRQRRLVNADNGSGKLNFGLTEINPLAAKLKSIYDPFFAKVSGIPGLDKHDETALNSLHEVSTGLKTLTHDVDQLVDQGTDPYNSFVKAYNRFDKLLSRNGQLSEVLAAVILLITCLSIIWLILASVVFAYYMTTHQDENPIHKKEEKRFMTHLTGFLTFGGIIWSIILFFVAALLMVLIYPVADGCSFSKYVLTNKEAFTKYPRLGNGMNLTYVDICVYGERGGRLSAVHQDISTAQLDKVQNIKIPVDKIQNINVPIDVSALRTLLDAPTTKANMYVLPTQTLALNDVEWLFTPDTVLKEKACEGTGNESPCKLMHEQVPAIPDTLTKVRGIPSLLQEYQTRVKAATGLVCTKKILEGTASAEVKKEKIAWDQKCSEITQTSQAIETCLKENVLNKECLSKLSSFVSDVYSAKNKKPITIEEYKTAQGKIKAEELQTLVRFGSRLLSVRQKLKRDHGSSHSPLPEATKVFGWDAVTFSDPCPIGEACDMFFKLRNRQSISDGYDLVDYDTWKESWLEDTKAAIEQMNTVKKVIRHVTEFATKQTTFSAYSDAGRKILAGDECYALSDQLVEMDKKLCDDVGGNIAGLGFMWFFMAIICLVGSVMCLLYWSSRRKYIDWEAIRRERERQRKYAECLQAAEVGDLARMERSMDEFQPGEVKDKDGNTPLHLAAKNGHPACVNKLVDSGYNVNELNYRGSSPIMEVAGNPNAPFARRADVVNKLIENGADINGFNESGNTPLMLSARNRDSDMAQLLVQKGANPNVRDAYNLTALTIARNNGDRRTMDALNNPLGGGQTNYNDNEPMPTDYSPPMSATPPAVNEELWTNRKSVETEMGGDK